jgi:hypothetical protein
MDQRPALLMKNHSLGIVRGFLFSRHILKRSQQTRIALRSPDRSTLSTCCDAEATSEMGLGCAKTRGSRISMEGFQPGARSLLSKISEFGS